MPPATNEEQFRFLISCIRWSNNGRVDFQEVANECNVVSKGAAAKRYERMMRAHGIHPNGGPITPSGSGSSPGSVPRARQPKAARDGADRYGKGKGKADKQKAKQAMFDEERDADMDDEELDHHPSSDAGIKDEPNVDGDDAEHLAVVKDEQNEEDIYTEDGDVGAAEREGRESTAGQRGDSADPITPRLIYSADSPSFAAQFGGGRISSPSPAESVHWSRTTPSHSSHPSTASAYGISSLTFPPLSSPPSTTLPQNGFDFNAYTPRQGSPSPFAFVSGGGVRTPEEVHEDQEMEHSTSQAIPQIDGAGSPRPTFQEQGGAKVVRLD